MRTDLRLSPSRPFSPWASRALLVLLWFVAIAPAFGAFAQAEAAGAEAGMPPIPSGSEVMVTDATGWRLLGYGLVEEDRLTLSISDDRNGDVSVVIFTPEGEITSMTARLSSGGVVLWFDDVPLPLEAWMAERGVVVTVESATEAARDDEDRDDEDRDDDDQDDENSDDDNPPGAPDDDRDDDDRSDDDREDEPSEDDPSDDDRDDADGGDDSRDDDEDDASDDAAEEAADEAEDRAEDAADEAEEGEEAEEVDEVDDDDDEDAPDEDAPDDDADDDDVDDDDADGDD